MLTIEIKTRKELADLWHIIQTSKCKDCGFARELTDLIKGAAAENGIDVENS